MNTKTGFILSIIAAFLPGKVRKQQAQQPTLIASTDMAQSSRCAALFLTTRLK